MFSKKNAIEAEFEVKEEKKEKKAKKHLSVPMRIIIGLVAIIVGLIGCVIRLLAGKSNETGDLNDTISSAVETINEAATSETE